ncbi:hypothetical protein C488_05923 [Natrinema pellirubrum DSM 15624]|uniref:Uncharacterized protein n=1 Tax=Natrinema pellirubrum (strain DSM 15624 / CIP 106293 / JCM 10476 / NCIMB 786 / 157) TaxID=797303 RepID=L9YXA7_NATP1|nr:hypothetical protein C488_05923 [Natrinema pellirubrum DSM 15624]
MVVRIQAEEAEMGTLGLTNLMRDSRYLPSTRYTRSTGILILMLRISIQTNSRLMKMNLIQASLESSMKT